MDTITLIRSAIRGLFAATNTALAGELRAVITSGDDYASTAKPQIDWDDQAAREALIGSRAHDGFAMLTLLQGRELGQGVDQAARLLATVLGQDLTDFPIASPACSILEAATVRHVRDQLLAAGLATAEEIETHLGNLARGDLDLMLAPMITAWGRKSD